MTSVTTAEATVPMEADGAAPSFAVSQVNKVKRVHERGRYDKKTIYEILDAALVCHIAYVIDDVDHKLKLMDSFIDRIYPGRSKLIRQPNKQELKATTMMGMEIETASGKIRDKHVADDEEDYDAVPAWSALYPVTQVLGAPSDCPRQLPGLARPDDMVDFAPGERLDEIMTKTYRRTFGE